MVHDSALSDTASRHRQAGRSMAFQDFAELAHPNGIVPVYRKLSADFHTPVSAYLRLRAEDGFSFLLESVEKGTQLGRYSFIGSRPERILAAGSCSVNSAVEAASVAPEQFFAALDNALQRGRAIVPPGLPSFVGGAVGFVGYDMIRALERLPDENPDVLGLPVALVAFYPDLVVFDHLTNEIYLVANVKVGSAERGELVAAYEQAQERLDALASRLAAPVPRLEAFHLQPESLQRNTPREAFLRNVERAKDYIFAGDIFQVVLSQRFSVGFSGDPFQVYRALRSINPSPYMFYLDFLQFQLIGSSPEPLIRVRGEELEIIPIAGTRPRGRSAEEDEALAAELLNDEKELAEHVMLVDLARNDLARVAEFGSVSVEDFQTIERYSHVMHIISRVRAKKRKDASPLEAFKAAFPAGTVSGAPKVRAMEIIEELEPEKRGVYAGAVGYFDFSGNVDTCIAIRTLIAKGGRIYLQAGAGIVADSDPQREYQETLNKIKALEEAILRASEGIHDLVHR